MSERIGAVASSRICESEPESPSTVWPQPISVAWRPGDHRLVSAGSITRVGSSSAGAGEASVNSAVSLSSVWKL